MNLLAIDQQVIEFTVYGKPVQQGSKSAFVQNGKVRMIEQNDARKREWRHSVVCAGQDAMNGRKRITGPVELRVTFCFRRPQSHYGSGKNAAVLKASAPKYHVQSPDLDKLVRNVGDSLTGVVLNDDRQIYTTVSRREWTEGPECAVVRIVEYAATEKGGGK